MHSQAGWFVLIVEPHTDQRYGTQQANTGERCTNATPSLDIDVRHQH